MSEVLQQLAEIFSWLSLLQFGGTTAVVPEMHRQVVDVMGWMSATTFTNLFALAQLAPGPNVMIVSLIGWQVAGFAGLVVATLAMTGPPCLLAFAMSRLMRRAGQSPWLAIVKDGLVPVAIGMILASGAVMLGAIPHNALTIGLVVASTLFVLFTDRNPLWPMVTAILIGIAVHHAGIV